MYLDTAIVIKLVTPEPDSGHWASLCQDQLLFSSDLMLTECFSALLRKEREGALLPKRRKQVWNTIESDVAERRINLVPISREILAAANAILAAAHPTVALRSLDAIHLASAQRCQSWPLVTNDGRMRDAAARLGMPLGALPR